MVIHKVARSWGELTAHNPQQGPSLHLKPYLHPNNLLTRDVLCKDFAGFFFPGIITSTSLICDKEPYGV